MVGLVLGGARIEHRAEERARLGAANCEEPDKAAHGRRGRCQVVAGRRPTNGLVESEVVATHGRPGELDTVGAVEELVEDGIRRG
jgi:hypothetical protein